MEKEIKEKTEYKIHENNIPWLEKKFKRMTTIAKEVGTKPPSYKIISEKYEEIFEPDPLEAQLQYPTLCPTGRYNKYYIITIDGESPKLAGWKFIATITFTPSGNLISKAPNIVEDLPHKYRTSNPVCDYCGKIRNRTDTFIVKNEKTNEYQQVGRNCLAKFLGYSNPEKVANYAEWLSNIEHDIKDENERYLGSGGHSDYYDLEYFLANVVAIIERDGWISKATAQATNQQPTISAVWNNINPISKYDKEHRVHPSKENFQRAKEAIEFARSDKLKTDTDYKHNLKVAMANNMFHLKAAGIVASIINFRDRDKQWEIEQQIKKEEAEKRKTNMKKSEWQGEIGDKINRTITVKKEILIDGQYGTTHLYKMIDHSNNIYTWFSSNNTMDEGVTYNITGTVKNHENYQDIKQTVLTRCKVKEIKITILPKEFKTSIVKNTKKPTTKKARKPKSKPRISVA